MTSPNNPLPDEDPRGLFYESYQMEGISEPECRTIFLDWALGAPTDDALRDVLSRVLAQYQPENPDHPMTQVLRESLERSDAPKRRGGWRARRTT